MHTCVYIIEFVVMWNWVYTKVDEAIATHLMSARFIYKHIYSLSPKRFSLNAINYTEPLSLLDRGFLLYIML